VVLRHIAIFDLRPAAEAVVCPKPVVRGVQHQLGPDRGRELHLMDIRIFEVVLPGSAVPKSTAPTMTNQLVLQIVEVGELSALAYLPRQLFRARPHPVVVEHLAAVVVVVPQLVVIEPLLMPGERVPELVRYNGTGHESPDIVPLGYVRIRTQV